MPDLPKITTQRLGARAHGSSHPEANLLTAFVENALSTRERTAILQHLSACVDCRDIVALSLPEQTLPAVVAAMPATPRFTWPLLRWAALAACVVVVGAAVMLRHRPRSSSQEAIAVQTSNSVSSEPRAAMSAPPATAASPSHEAREQLAYSARGPVFIPGPSSKRSPGRPPTPPAPNDQLSNPTMADAKSALARADVSAGNAPAEPAAPNANLTADEVIPGRAKDAAQHGESMRRRAAAAPMAMEKSANAGLVVNKLSASGAALQVPRWTLTSDGALQRSVDAGQTWQPVPITERTSTFRALAANGLDIWVGGAQGALYHSSDAGQHWTQVQPIANGELLSSDIIGVQFTDLQHGSVTTATKETWNTADAGQTWTKQ